MPEGLAEEFAQWTTYGSENPCWMPRWNRSGYACGYPYAKSSAKGLWRFRRWRFRSGFGLGCCRLAAADGVKHLLVGVV